MRSGPRDERAEKLKSEEGQKRRCKKYFPNISTETCITGKKRIMIPPGKSGQIA